MLKRQFYGLMTVIIGLALVFSFIACDNGNGDNGNSGDGRISGWPNSSTLSSYGISGLTKPNDATNVIYFDAPSTVVSGDTVLSVYFTGTTASLNTIRTWFDNQNDWTKSGSNYRKTSGNVSYSTLIQESSGIEGRNCVLMITKRGN